MNRAVLILCFVAACGGAKFFGSKDEPAGPWRELTSEHFVVWTNAAPTRAPMLMREMENLRQVVLGVSFFKQEIPGKSFVIAFDDQSEVTPFLPKQFIARAWSGGNILRQPVIVLSASALVDDRSIVTHELTHVISFNVIQNQPAWFAEGIAGYFETVRLDEDKGTIEVGAPIDGRMRQIHDDGLTPIRAVFACEQDACKDDRFYATTWALVTYLLNEHAAEMTQYMAKLIETPADQQAQLWAKVFLSLPPEKLDHELASWLRYGRHTVMKYNVALRKWPVTERPISEADVWAMKGLLRYFQAPKTVSAETTKALELDPTNLIANLINAISRDSISTETAQAVTAAHPDDWRAWWLAWRAATTGVESREAKNKTCSLLAQSSLSGAVPDCAVASPPEPEPSGPDPRFQVFVAATPQINDCLKKTKRLDAGFNIDVEIDDAGAVTSAHATVGSPAANACVEAVMKSLAFPPHHAGPYHLSTSKE